ncbi:hypothetical protein [Burkholderia cepacia]|uniref:hypothetical protein n=1 Tax=Burkholderia cepacia TaxID=292 RepID=UPI001F449C49|nr:hypothetical protein [Burkholderia cepacia]MCE4125799.1 hypothetical protein [Burkholderia cepacia]
MSEIDQVQASWRAERWSCHAATTVVVDDARMPSGKRVIAEYESEKDALLGAAAPDMAMVLEMIGADADAGAIKLTSGIRMWIDASLIKAGRKAAPHPVNIAR